MTIVDSLRRTVSRALLDYDIDSALLNVMRTEMRAAAAEIELLIRVGEGRLAHDYQGLCPDAVEGYDSRDPDCSACRVLEGTYRD